MNKTELNIKQLFKDKQVRFQAMVALLVLAVGILLSLGGFVELQKLANERLYLQTQQHTAAQIKQIQTNIDISLDSLTDISGLYQASGDVYRSQLASYINSDTKYHSGTVALGWAPLVLGEDITKFEAEVNQRDSNFTVYEVTGHGVPVPVSKDKASYPLKFMITPENKSMKAGLNLASISSRNRVMKKAERIQSTAITQRISLYSGSRQFYGFQALHPVFKLNTLGQQEIAGYVLGNYDIRSLIEDVFSANSRQLDIAVYDANTSSQQLLYSSSKQLASFDDIAKQQPPHWTYTLKVADQQWILVAFPNLAALNRGETWLPYIGLVVGGLMTVLLILYLFVSLIKTRQLARLATDLAGTTTQLDIQTQLKQEADKANQAKSGLLRAASHDLRQPLHTIGLLMTLLKSSKSEDEGAKLIDKVLAAVDGMNSMFISLLDISLLESNQLPIHQQHFYLQDVLDKLVNDFSVQAKQKQLSFSAPETSTCVETDPILLERILRNLLSNAFRYTPTGKVLLGCRRLKTHIRICVLDSGIGLSKEAQEKVFDSFYREKQAKQLSDQGLGLGLSIVQEAASVLKLEIGMQSQHGKGSLFYLDVPYGDPALIGEVKLIKPQAQINKAIWLIEDDETIRSSLEKILQSWQCRVDSCASGEGVQQLLNQKRSCPDIIIADYQLINETGLELVKLIQASYQQTIPVIMITGTTDIEARKLIEKAGHHFMMKPVSADDLNQTLQQF
ncbi:CHASE domain-containing protein [Pseudomonadota bacterium]|nr:CHASE domain-containing protein [Pseudomonadota bacterium]